MLEVPDCLMFKECTECTKEIAWENHLACNGIITSEELEFLCLESRAMPSSIETRAEIWSDERRAEHRLAKLRMGVES